MSAQMALADLPLKAILAEPIVPHECDEVTRLICDGHDSAAFAPIAHLTVGEFRDCQICVLAHVTTQMVSLRRGTPIPA